MAETDIPDHFADQQRPDEPSVINAFIEAVIAFLTCQPFIWFVGFCVVFYQFVANFPRWPGFEAAQGTLLWMSIISVPFSAWVGWGRLTTEEENLRHYESRYREWAAKEERRRAEVREAERRAAERNLQQERDSELADRRRRLADLEAMLLRAHAQHVVDADFWGSQDPAVLTTGFRSQLGKLVISDLGLLRETKNRAVQIIIGDGSTLPPTPPLQTRLSIPL